MKKITASETEKQVESLKAERLRMQLQIIALERQLGYYVERDIRAQLEQAEKDAG